jgi:hypothetical protein
MIFGQIGSDLDRKDDRLAELPDELAMASDVLKLYRDRGRVHQLARDHHLVLVQLHVWLYPQPGTEDSELFDHISVQI